MDRSDCSDCDIVGDDIYCMYFDYMFRKCVEIKVCPSGLDRDDYEDDLYDTSDDDIFDL